MGCSQSSLPGTGPAAGARAGIHVFLCGQHTAQLRREMRSFLGTRDGGDADCIAKAAMPPFNYQENVPLALDKRRIAGFNAPVFGPNI